MKLFIAKLLWKLVGWLVPELRGLSLPKPSLLKLPLSAAQVAAREKRKG